MFKHLRNLLKGKSIKKIRKSQTNVFEANKARKPQANSRVDPL